MQKSKPPKGWPWRTRRAGASAEFARAMAKAEFGRHYVSDRDLEEVQRSLGKPKTSGMPAAANAQRHGKASSKGKR